MGLTAQLRAFLSPIFQKKSLAGLFVVIELIFPRRQKSLTNFPTTQSVFFWPLSRQNVFCRDRFQIVDNFLLDFFNFCKIRPLSRFFLAVIFCKISADLFNAIFAMPCNFKSLNQSNAGFCFLARLVACLSSIKGRISSPKTLKA